MILFFISLMLTEECILYSSSTRSVPRGVEITLVASSYRRFMSALKQQPSSHSIHFSRVAPFRSSQANGLKYYNTSNILLTNNFEEFVWKKYNLNLRVQFDFSMQYKYSAREFTSHEL